MNCLLENWISFVVVYCLFIICDVDNIIVMNYGLIVEIGNYDILMEKDGFYVDFYNS